jgi:hypothetical protein
MIWVWEIGGRVHWVDIIVDFYKIDVSKTKEKEKEKRTKKKHEGQPPLFVVGAVTLITCPPCYPIGLLLVTV